VRRALCATVAGALILPAAALAHVNVLPAFLEGGQQTTLLFTAPNERPPHAVIELSVTVPEGVDLTRLAPPPGWSLTISGTQAVWSGGRTLPRTIGVFRLAATTDDEPTAVDLHASQRYDDGGVVRWTIPFTILPAPNPPKQHLLPALLVGIAGLFVIAGGLAFARLRRRPQQTQPRSG